MLARYGGERIRKGMLHFLMGKGLSSIVSLIILVLLVRHLKITEFAAYSVLQAFVYVFTALTGFGLLHITLRYIPELYTQHQGHALRVFMLWTFGLRVVLLTSVALVAYSLGSQVASIFGLLDWIAVFQIYLVVVWLKVNNHFLFQIHESTLHQGPGQAVFLATTLLKLTLIVWLMEVGELNLLNIVWVELIAELVAMFAFCVSVIRIIQGSEVESNGIDFKVWWTENSRRVTKYGIAGYFQQLLIIPYGSAPNRLVAGHFLGATSVAEFGFSQSFVDLINRYLPAQLLGGLIRPVIVAKYSIKRDFSEVTRPLNFIFRLNTILLGLILALILSVGQQVVNFISNGNYGAEVALLLASMVCVLMLDSHRFMLDIAIHAIEKYDVLIVGNFILASSLLLIVGLLPWCGTVAIPLAGSIGLLASNSWIAHRLEKLGFNFSIGIFDFMRVLAITLAAAGFGYLLSPITHWLVVIPLVSLAHLTLLWMTGAIRNEDWLALQHLKRIQSNQAT